MSSAAPAASPTQRPQFNRARSASRLRRRVEQALEEHLAPPPLQTVSQWADEYRQLSRESSSSPGRWRTDFMPWLRAPMDAASDPEVEEIVLEFASQAGKTEVLNNIIGQRIDHDPGPMLAVFSTLSQATTWSKDRLTPMCRDTPPLQNALVDRGSRRTASSEILEKKFTGGLLAITGANSATELSGRPIRDLFLDETDRFPLSAGGRGGDEGSPILLAKKRTSNFPDSLHYLSSSPGIKGRSAIDEHYQQTDRNRWWVPCPACGHEQIMLWKGVNFGDADLTRDQVKALSHEERAARARYECEACGDLWDDVTRWEAAASGRWIPQSPRVVARRGFWINALVSPFMKLSSLVSEWLEAQGNPMSLQVFINTRLAELYDDAGERLLPEAFVDRPEPYPPSAIPQGVVTITAGCDVQTNPPRIEVTRVGWGMSNEVWVLDHTVLDGDPATLLEAHEDTRLDDLLLRSRWTREDGAPMRVVAAAIDSGGGFYEDVLAYAKKRRTRNIFAIRGKAGESTALWPTSGRLVKRKGKASRAVIYTIGVDHGKTWLYRTLKRERPEDWRAGEPIPGFIHWPTRPEFDSEYFCQLVGEVPRPKRIRGRITLEWVQEYPRVEALDCMVYAYAVLAWLTPNWRRISQKLEQAAESNRVVDEPDIVADPDDESGHTPAPRPRKRARGEQEPEPALDSTAKRKRKARGRRRRSSWMGSI